VARAVRDHGNRLAGSVRRVHLDLDVQHGRQATQALRADAQRVDLLVQLQTQLLDAGQLRSATAALACSSYISMIIHQAFLGHQHRLLGRAADADAQHARRAPTGAHGRHGLEHPVHDRVTGVEHVHLALVLAAATLGGDGHFDGVAGHDLGVDNRRGVVLGVLAQELRVCDDRGAQGIGGIVVAAAHAFVDGVVQASGEALPAHVHADFQEHVDDTGVLADRAVAGGAHLAVGQDLRDRVLGGRALLALIGARQVGDVVRRVVVADVLQGGSDRFDEVVLADGGHGGGLSGWFECGCGGPGAFGRRRIPENVASLLNCADRILAKQRIGAARSTPC
jgi:hypothetical protein